MKFNPPLQQATLIKRYKRFLVDIDLGNEITTIHCANTGKMTGCADEGFNAFYSTSDNKKRKYPHSLQLTQNNHGHFIGVNTMNANEIVSDALAQGLLPSLSGYQTLTTEVKYGEQNSRIDIKLDYPDGSVCYLEIKSTTLLLDETTGLGAFPDAKTERGQKHLQELMAMKKQGHKTCLVFLVQHTGIQKMTVAKDIDAKYAKLLAECFDQGVEILVLHTHIDAAQIIATHTSEFVWP